MFDVKPGPIEGSNRLICWSRATRGVRIFDVYLGPLERPEWLMLSLGPSKGQNV